MPAERHRFAAAIRHHAAQDGFGWHFDTAAGCGGGGGTTARGYASFPIPILATRPRLAARRVMIIVRLQILHRSSKNVVSITSRLHLTGPGKSPVAVVGCTDTALLTMLVIAAAAAAAFVQVPCHLVVRFCLHAAKDLVVSVLSLKQVSPTLTDTGIDAAVVRGGKLIGLTAVFWVVTVAAQHGAATGCLGNGETGIVRLPQISKQVQLAVPALFQQQLTSFRSQWFAAAAATTAGGGGGLSSIIGVMAARTSTLFRRGGHFFQ